MELLGFNPWHGLRGAQRAYVRRVLVLVGTPPPCPDRLHCIALAAGSSVFLSPDSGSSHLGFRVTACLEVVEALPRRLLVGQVPASSLNFHRLEKQVRLPRQACLEPGAGLACAGGKSPSGYFTDNGQRWPKIWKYGRSSGAARARAPSRQLKRLATSCGHDSSSHPANSWRVCRAALLGHTDLRRGRR